MFQRLTKIGTALLLAFTFLLYMLPSKSLAFGPTENTIYDGIDVSGYQGDIDFAKVKQAGIEIVYIKSSEGFSYIDSHFERNYAKAKENGLKVGFYHFVTARTVEQAKRQAQFFVSLTSHKSPDCKLAMDFETFGNLTKEQINEIGLTFLQEVERLSKKEAILYSNAYAASNIWNGEVTKYPLWIAQYEVEKPQNNGTWQTWAGWQYTDIGEASGIKNYVDKNYFTKEVFLSDTSEIPPVEPPKEEDETENENTMIITIKKGDTLSSLARKYNTTVSKLVELNHIANPNLIYAGNTLIVPTTENTSSNKEIYIVRSGDTLSEIAQQFQTTVQIIAKENNIQNVNLIYPGQKLIVRSNCKYDCGHRLYTVQRGDTLWSIAKRYHTTIANIVRLNRIKNPNLIFPGQMFRI